MSMIDILIGASGRENKAGGRIGWLIWVKGGPGPSYPFNTWTIALSRAPSRAPQAFGVVSGVGSIGYRAGHPVNG
jgi:hypothetical protein